MAKRKKAKTAVPYVQRLAEDEYVQKQLRTAATRLRKAYGRVSRKRGKSAEDKKLYGDLREAATSIRRAALGLQRPPEPKHRGRKVLLAALAGGTAAAIAKGRSRGKETPAATT